MPKTLMILGAGYGQLPAIEKAQEMGYRVIATSIYPNDIGMNVADIALNIDTTDIDNTLKAARRYAVDGILTMATDVAVPGVGKIVDELGLVGPSFQAARLSTNKVLMKNRFLKRNVPTAKAKFVKTLAEARTAIAELGLPVMIKAVDSSGSRGISKVERESQLEKAFGYAKTTSKTDIFVVEEFLEGLEFGVQSLIRKGKLKFIFPHNDTVTPPPYSTPIGHSYPIELTIDEEKEIFDIVAKSTAALEIDNSMLNIDLMMTDRGPKIIEIGARMGATCLPELTTIYSGIDMVEAAVTVAMGQEPNLCKQINKQPCAALLIRSPETGRLKTAELPNYLLGDQRLIAVRWDKKPGDLVRKFKVGPDRIGEIIVISDTWQSAENFCGTVESQLNIVVD